MKITDIKVRYLEIPFPVELRSTWGHGRPEKFHGVPLVEVHTDEGVTGYGTAALHMSLENDWRRGRAGYLASAVFALLQLVNLVRFGDEFAWGSVSGVLYLVLLLSFGALGFTGWLRSRVR